MKKYFFIIILVYNFIFSEMLKPSNGALLNYRHILFEWEQIIGQSSILTATSYNIQVDDNSNFSSPIISTNNESLIYILDHSINWNTTYYWRIQPVFSDGSIGPWENPYYFTTGSQVSNAYALNYSPTEYSEGITMFSSFFNYFSAALDQNGNEIWNTGNDDIVYYNTDYFGQLFGCHLDFSVENYLPGIEFSLDSHYIWEEPNDDFLHHEMLQLPNGNYMGLVEDIQLGPIPEGDWSILFMLSGYQADGVTNEFPWVGDKIVIWDKDTKEVIWEWNSFDHFSMLDFDTYNTWDQALSLNRYDWTHANAFFTTFDENNELESIYLSSRHLSRITKIDYETGEVDWNLGLEMPSGDVDCGQDINFSFQHSVTVLENGNIVTLDNGNLSQYLNNTTYPTSRGLEIQIDESNGGCSSEVVWEYSLAPELFGYASGNVQKLDNGNYLLVTIGDTGTALEVNNSNQPIWEGKFALQLPNGAVYRANRLSSLYPIAFSTTINNLSETTTENYPEGVPGIYSINTEFFDFEYNIFNEGSLNEDYEITLEFDNGYSITNIVNISSNYLQSFNIENDMNFVNLKVSPLNRSDLQKTQTIYFTSSNDCDLDGDGICDDEDDCILDPLNDIDNDGLCAENDPCPNDSDNDIDNDGLCADVDDCPFSTDIDIDGDGLCGDVDECPYDYFNDSDNDGLCDSDDPCPFDINNNCNSNLCDDGYTYYADIPNSTVVLDGSSCFSNNDLSVLNDIIVLNELNVTPIYLGTQNWNNGRITRIEAGNYYQGGDIVLTEIPESINQLTQLAVIYFDNNALTTLPESISELNNLIYLVLSFNQLTSLPNTIGNLSNLIWIDVGYNQLESIPESIGQLQNLIYLWIFNNNLSELPNSICNLNLNFNSLDYSFLPYFGSGGNLLCENLPECVENSDNLNTSIDPLYYSFVITEEQDCNCTLFDVNADGTVNVIDIVSTVNIIFSDSEIDEAQSCAADVNEDGIINVIDIVTLVNYIFDN